ncbi:hypothetical protein [Aquipuribacter hungaricus]|uniref:Uncharacterized protein n=1 Tax=Aquipuribacter hungaricus TaxID=545624 RepID=A0ABV7WK16_9MICO
MSTPTSSAGATDGPAVTTQAPPPLLSRALDLLDGLLLRDDVPTPAVLDLGDVFGDLLDVRPPYPPTSPVSSTDPWPVVLDQVLDALHELITTPDDATPPARAVGYAFAVRTLRQHQAPRHDPGPAVAAQDTAAENSSDGATNTVRR